MKRLQLVVDEVAYCMFEYVYFANPASEINGTSIYEGRLRLGRELARQLRGIKADYIVPVPDTSRTAAQALSEELRIPVREAIIKNRYMQRTFIMGSEKTRKKAAKQKYLFLPHLIKGKKLIIVDDSIVRGLTSKRIVEKLRELGAKEIHFAVTCPPLRYPCYYGVDFPNDQELIASGKSEEEIAEYLGVDSLTYLSIEGLQHAIGTRTLCYACITGEYPTRHGRKIRERVKKGEINGGSHYE